MQPITLPNGDAFVYSNEDCCNKCHHLIFDTDAREHFCELLYEKPIHPYTPACENIDRILQGFGE